MFDNPIFFLILISVISAISDWLGKRRKAKRLAEEERSGEIESMPHVELELEPEPLRPRQSQSEQKQEWEERLRRLLEGEESPVQPGPQPIPSAYSEPRRSSYGEATNAPEEYSFGGGAVSDGSFAESSVADRAQERQQELLAASSRAREAKSISAASSKSAPSMRVTRIGGRKGRVETNFHSKSSIRRAIVAAVVLGAPKGSGDEADLLKI